MRKARHRRGMVCGIVVALLAAGAVSARCSAAEKPSTEGAKSMWDVAQKYQQVHRFSTLFDARTVGERLVREPDLLSAIDWCKRTGVTKVYVENFRDGYEASRASLERARDRFRAAGLEVSGCVTTTRLGKVSSGWNVVACYTDQPTQQRLQEIFEHEAALFDEIMIDDFLFTDCTCAQCDAARRARTVTIGAQTYPVPGDGWDDYHCEMMVHLSRDRILAPAKRVNANVKLIIKYPQWYDNFHRNGYEVVRQTEDFDRIWVGTETRDYGDRQWGGTPQYEAYFIMRWLGGIGGAKCGGGWYDWLGTTPLTYIEQARQTILGGARESLLFNYSGLQNANGADDAEALRKHIPELLEVAQRVKDRPIIGVAAYKPPNSPPGNEARVFDFVGMMGLPLVPCHEFPVDAPAAFLSLHAMKDPSIADHLGTYIASGRPVLITDGLADALRGRVKLDAPNVRILAVKGSPAGLLSLPQAELDATRRHLLAPLKIRFSAPNRVGLYLFGDGSWVIENFGDATVNAELNGASQRIAARGWSYHWQ